MYRAIVMPALALICLLALGATVMFYHPENNVGATRVERLK